jgi:uncharacterized membrane protein
MDVETVLKFLHVAAASVFVAGLIGRGLVLGRARRSRHLAEIELYLKLSDPFEKMVVQGSIAVLVLGIVTMIAQGRPLFQEGSYWLPTSIALFATIIVLVPTVFIPRGKAFGRALDDARQRGEVTGELERAFRDDTVAFARIYEFVVVGIMGALMVLKPF